MGLTVEVVSPSSTSKRLQEVLLAPPALSGVEMGRSSADAEVWLKNSYIETFIDTLRSSAA